MTVGNLRRAGESGYLPGDWDQFVILVPGRFHSPEVVVRESIRPVRNNFAYAGQKLLCAN